MATVPPASPNPPGGPPGAPASAGPWSARDALSSLLELVPLDHLPRTGWIQRGVEAPESLAGHTAGVAFVALALAPQIVPALDLGRVLSMALVHDAPEALTGDLPQPVAQHLPAGAKHAMERSVAQPLLGALSGPALRAFEEFQDQETREARFVKQCDRVQLGVRLLAYEISGRRGLDEFWGGLGPSKALPGDSPEFPEVDDLLAAIRAGRVSG